MAFKIFTIPLPHTQDREQEVNAFLAGHAVVGVQRRFIEKADEAFLVFLIEFDAGSSSRREVSAPPASRIDWQAELSDDDYRVFNLLRDERSKMADEDGVKLFNIFTNAQLVEMVKRRVCSKAALEKIPKVGEGRVNKYGERLLSILAQEYAAALPAEAEKPQSEVNA